MMAAISPRGRCGAHRTIARDSNSTDRMYHAVARQHRAILKKEKRRTMRRWSRVASTKRTDSCVCGAAILHLLAAVAAVELSKFTVVELLASRNVNHPSCRSLFILNGNSILRTIAYSCVCLNYNCYCYCCFLFISIERVHVPEPWF